MATTKYRPVHETTEIANNGKVTGNIRGSYVTHADKHTKVFINKMEKLGLYTYTKSRVIIKGKL